MPSAGLGSVQKAKKKKEKEKQETNEMRQTGVGEQELMGLVRTTERSECPVRGREVEDNYGNNNGEKHPTAEFLTS